MLIPRKTKYRKSQDFFVSCRCSAKVSARLIVEDNMDIPTLLYNLRDEVSCSVCSDIFTDPKQLSCLHSFCLKCLNQWYRTCGGGSTVKCPKCQTLSRVPASGDLKDLPTSFYLNGLIDVLAIKECNSTHVTCGNCDKRSSEASYCFQCCIFYCEECLIGHNMMRGNKDHRVLAVKEFQDRDYEEVLKRPTFCPKPRHEKEELKFFCKNCEVAICQTCVTLEHSGHAFEHIEDEAERQKTEMQNVVQTQRQNLQAKKNSVRQLDEDCAKLMQQGEDVKRDVQNFADNLIGIIEAKTEAIFAAVEKQTKKSLESLGTKKNKIDDEIKVIESSLEKADKLLTRSTNAELVRLKKSLETVFEQVGLETVPTTLSYAQETLVFVKNRALLNTVNSEEIGSLQMPHQTKASQSIAEGKGLNEAFAGYEAKFTLTTKNAERKQFYDKRDHVALEIRDERGRECATEVKINDNKNGTYHISYSARTQGRCSIIVKVNGEHVHGSPFAVLVKAREQALSPGNLSARGKIIEARSPFLSASASCYVLPEQGACSQAVSVTPFPLKALSSFGKQGSSLGLFRYPWVVAVSNRDEIAVTDKGNHRVQVFDSSGNYFRSFGREGTSQGEFQSPLGICFDNNGNIFVADNGNHIVQIFSGEGKYMGMFGGKGSLDSQLSYPWGLSLDANGNIIVADAGNKLIKIFSRDGKFIKKIGEPGSFSFPVHCVERDGYLIVSDAGEHCIKVFSRSGDYLYKFGKQGEGDGEFCHPWCLSVNKSGHLMVCDGSNHRIQVFELNGKFVGKFGTSGSNLGQFNDPTSLAVLSDGRIVVCDGNNHRIQILQ